MKSKMTYSKAVFILMSSTFLMKLISFIREMLIGYRFGATYITDAYLMALTIPNLIFTGILAALNTTVIPMYIEINAENEKKSKKFLSNTINVITILMIIVVIITIIFNKEILLLIANGFDEKTMNLAKTLSTISIFSILLMGPISILNSYLNANKKFNIAVLAQIPGNLLLIIFLFNKNIDINIIIILNLLVYIIQLFIIVQQSKIMGFKFKFIVDFKDSNLIRLVKSTIPTLLTVGVQQINTIIDRALASNLVSGSISALSYANKVNLLVFGIVGTSISTIAYEDLSRNFVENNINKFKKSILKGINIITLITVMIVAILITFSNEIVKILFERGAFDLYATKMTSGALVCYSFGMLFFAYRDYLSKIFYSMKDIKTPAKNSMITVIINIILNCLLVNVLGHRGLALATSLSATIMTVLLLKQIDKNIDMSKERKEIIGTIFKCVSAAIISSILMKILYLWVLRLNFNNIIIFLSLIIIILLGIVVYVVFCYIFRIGELNKIHIKIKKLSLKN